MANYESTVARVLRHVYEFFSRMGSWGAPFTVEYKTNQSMEIHFPDGEVIEIRATVKGKKK